MCCACTHHDQRVPSSAQNSVEAPWFTNQNTAGRCKNPVCSNKNAPASQHRHSRQSQQTQDASRGQVVCLPTKRHTSHEAPAVLRSTSQPSCVWNSSGGSFSLVWSLLLLLLFNFERIIVSSSSSSSTEGDSIRCGDIIFIIVVRTSRRTFRLGGGKRPEMGQGYRYTRGACGGLLQEWA